jgi:hypothetical protein
MAEDWQFLSNSVGRLDHPLYQPLAHDNYPREYRLLALESFLRSGEIPMRGCRMTSLGLAPSERIETKIDVETAIDIPLDEITFARFTRKGRRGSSLPFSSGCKLTGLTRFRFDF